MTAVSYAAELQFAFDFVSRSVREILRTAEQAYRIDTKRDGTVVTSADLEINRSFIEHVVDRFPGDSVLGEEASHSAAGGNGRTWVIDPIDGTQQFILGVPVFMTSIALVVAGRPVLGVLSNPSTRDLYWATTGGGAFRNGTAIHVSTRDGRTEPLTLVGAGAMPTPAGLDADTLLETFVSPTFRTTAHRFPWPTVFSGCKVAEGTWDADLYDSTGAHDVAAICILVREAGGTVTNRHGADQRYDTAVDGCVSSNGAQHSTLVRHWADVRHQPPAHGADRSSKL
ncbi:inositol monophosphatase [Kribbella flavida DSM 17836]|uniref:Inositol monophosphatase n=1 Tax=Kribbella flavida (strain DSM 17836 / JCM 10339 / NBRC 14399) TaxID=479435 RepID=D2PQZ6_KRIFD|nr:inositol monophosphatase [Kribbella flavida]ADB31129.1 inositol monophosphatase [Kribbella flavida DSM 17836]